MIYIVFKNSIDKENFMKNITNINNTLYDGNDVILNKFYTNVKFINFDSIDNKIIDSFNDDYINCIEDNIYYKFYDIKYHKVTDFSLGDIINLYTSTISYSKEKLYSIAKYGDESNDSFGFFGKVSRFYESLINNVDNKDDDILNLGFLAFSNRVNTYTDNDLLNGYLYDRKGFKDKYEKIMGEDSLARLNYYQKSITITLIDSNSIPKIEYLGLLEDLRKYFLINMSKKDNISLQEKNTMIINFNSLYTKLRDDYLNNKKKTF